VKTNDAFERTIEEAFTGECPRLALQARVAFPENVNNFTSDLPSPLPIPDPYDELLAVILPFKIVRFQTVELPE
jgi:hypothetical protein